VERAASTFRLRPARDVPEEAARLLEPGVASFSVAYGSNASPARLRDKGLTARGAILLPAVVPDWVAAFEARRTGYGAVPLTFLPSAGAVTRTWVLGLPVALTPLLDRTEGRVPEGTPAEPGPEEPGGRFAPPGTYQLGRIGEAVVAGVARLRDVPAYLPGPATRVQVVDEGWRTWPDHDQAAAAAHLDRDGPSRPAPPVPEPVLGPWPATPLEPLP